jgi:group I intron endonuclease
LNTRKRVHIRELSNGVHRNKRMQNAFNKYQTAHFEVMETVASNGDLIGIEQQYISRNHSDPRCMNIAPTAGNCLGVKHSQEARQNMRNAHLGGRNCGMFHPLYGKCRPDSTRKKISARLLGRKLSEDHVKNIRKGQSKKSVRLKMSEAKKGKNQTREHIEKRASQNRGGLNHKSKCVWIKLPNAEKLVFETITDAAKVVGISGGSLARYLSGSRNWPAIGGCRNDKTKSLIGIKGGYLT